MLQHIIVFWTVWDLTHERMLSHNEGKGRTNICAITNYLVLNLLPALHTALNEHLR
jgi:hypothetical protein